MADPVYLRTGSSSQADGSIAAARGAKTGEQCVQQTHGKYYEAVVRGNVYSAQTAATGVAPGTALGTTGAFTLSNPKGSGKKLVVQKLGVGLISGTIGSGVIHICSQNDPTATAPTGTAITPRNRYAGAANNSVAQPLTTSTIPTSAGGQTGILCSTQKQVPDTTTGQPFYDVEKDIDGEIVIQPGCSITLHATSTGGSTPLVVFSATWEEVSV